ncbi:MAG: hypothetical protein EOM58_06265, partial [Clostridia bacterium]|nr:hypothetical protein [Clostridia bacterium]
MSRVSETPLDMRRLTELSERADQTGCAMYTPFLTPPEAELAIAAAKRQGVRCVLFGGYDDAERKMACFTVSDDEPDFPIDAVKITWRGNEKPDHRSLLGSVTGLGLSRQKLGDIVALQELAWLFAQRTVSPYVCENLLTAGRVQVTAEISECLPQLEAPAGEELRDTVLSTRLDALIASGYHLSRSKACALIAHLQVFLVQPGPAEAVLVAEVLHHVVGEQGLEVGQQGTQALVLGVGQLLLGITAGQGRGVAGG